jgi:AcrR family transcriptional regulator
MATTRLRAERRVGLDNSLSATGGTDRSRRPLRTRRQEAILDHLEQLFLADGFRHLTLQDLTDELHCSRTILYALAPTKEELTLVVIDRWLRKIGAALNAAVDGAKTPDQQLEAALDAVAGASESATNRFMSDTASYGPTNELHMRHSRYLRHRLQDIVEDGLTTGTFRPVDARFAAEVVNMVITEISDGTLLERTGLKSTEAIIELKELLFRGLLHRPEPALVRRKVSS